jgi:hypothetical protein
MPVLVLRRREDCLRDGLRAISVVERLVLGKPCSVCRPTEKVAICEIDELRLWRMPVASLNLTCRHGGTEQQHCSSSGRPDGE